MSKTPIPTLVGDVITALDTIDERREAASQLLAYSLAALVALDGRKAAAEAAYRYADAVVSAT